jgi:formiminoglutamase
MTLPLLISVPHAGLEVPAQVRPYCRLTPGEIAADGDEGAAGIYRFENEFRERVTTPVARAIVDMNRAPDDRRKDGVIKTHTCWNVPIYEPTPPESIFETILGNHYHPYHAALKRIGRSGTVIAGIDCHTMAAQGPPVGPDPGVERPWICLGNAEGSCPTAWIEELAARFSAVLDGSVTINVPFSGGFITRSHSGEMPWIQMEMSRAPFMTNEDKRRMVLEVLTVWCGRIDTGLVRD